MKILIACLHHASCTGRFLRDGFFRLGHEVRHIGFAGNTIPNIAGWYPQGDFDHVFPEPDPDLIIYAETAYKPWHHEGYRHVPHVAVVTCNNVVNMRDDPPLDRDQRYAAFFMAHRDSEVWPVKEDDEHWLPCAHDPTLHTPPLFSWDDRDYDVTLIGSIGEYRNEWLDYLETHDLKVQRDTRFGHDYVIAYHNSRISLCISQYKSPMMRFFETAAMGCLIVGDYCPEFRDLNPVAKGMVFVKTPQEAAAVCRYYLDHPAQAQSMIKSSMAWAAYHTWGVRAQQIVDWYEKE